MVQRPPLMYQQSTAPTGNEAFGAGPQSGEMYQTADAMIYGVGVDVVDPGIADRLAFGVSSSRCRYCFLEPVVGPKQDGVRTAYVTWSG